MRARSRTQARGRFWATALVLPSALALLLLSPDPSRSQIPLADSESFSLGLSGYFRSLTGIHDAGFVPPIGDRRSGFHADVARFRWRARWEDSVVLEVHNRVQASVSSSAQGFGGSVAGFGVSAEPGRSVDLESIWIDQERLRVWHDLDRLSLTFYTPAADLTIGRQAITWGTSLLFPVADLWAQFSPFELDTEEKPGVDAIRILAYPASTLELDLIVADRGRRDHPSAGLRATWSLSATDVYGAVGRFWNEAILMGGGAWLLDSWKVRAEVAVARDLEEDRWPEPRGTIGIDWLGTRLMVTAEHHFNGLGASNPERYLGRLQGEPFARGESYFLGRHYLGGLVSWAVDAEERLRISVSALMNLGDPSGAFLPALSWDLGQSTSLSFGGLIAMGDRPEFSGELPQLRSEYGTYGDLFYAQISAYF